MSIYYTVDGINVKDLITQSGSLTQSFYINFPTCIPDNRGIAKCDNFGYSVNGVDIGTTYRGIQYDCPNSSSLDISIAPYRKFKHVSSLLYGGGGGGGGGGGAGWNGGNRAYPTVSGGYGGYGGYSYIRKTIITDKRVLAWSIGTGGNGGGRGGDSNTPSQSARTGGDGAAGNAGNATTLNYYFNGSNTQTGLHSANGGTGGNGGPGGRSATVPNAGTAGSTTGGTGGSSADADTANSNSYLYRPTNDGTPGNGGGSQTNGNSARDGYCWLWFTYEKNT
jgi:hypothetical protein